MKKLSIVHARGLEKDIVVVVVAATLTERPRVCRDTRPTRPPRARPREVFDTVTA